MEWLKYTALALATFLIAFGLLTLALAWLAPRKLDTRFMTGMLTGQRLEPNRRNRSLASVGSVVSGAYIWLSMGRLVLPALLALAVWMVITLLLRRARRPAPPTTA